MERLVLQRTIPTPAERSALTVQHPSHVSYLAQTLLVSSVILDPAECANGAANAGIRGLFINGAGCVLFSVSRLPSQSEISISCACAARLAGHNAL